MHHFLIRPAAALLLALPLASLPVVAMAQAAPAPVDLAPFIRKDTFENIRLSPTGEYFAATVPFDDRTGLVIMRIADKKITARFTLGKDTHFEDLYWVNDGRLLTSISEAYGTRDQPSSTGELFGVDIDGKNQRMLVGYRAEINTDASRIRTASGDSVYAELVDDLPGEENYVLVAVTPYVADAYTRLERMDVRNGKRTPVSRIPAKYGEFTVDNAGIVRMGEGSGKQNESLLFHRADDKAEWTLINDENKTGRIERPIGFSPDNRTAYLLVEQATGPDAVVAWDTVSGERREVAKHASHDPSQVLYNLGSGIVPVGVRFDSGPVAEDIYFGDEQGDVRTYRMLAKAFAGNTATITSTTADGKRALVHVGNATNPGDFYLFDVANRKADLLLTRYDWFDPAAMGEVRAVSLPARDGRTLHGVLTLPPGSNGRGLPLIVNPHGGPIGIRDGFSFETETQLLARAGYAVLQVNYRGSAGYGRDFQQAGARQWGGTMQDDLTDATKWAIAQGLADPRRICLYGASYGAYASLMGVAREPDLYKCAVGYVGVYDLDQMIAEDSDDSASSAEWNRQWVGEKGKMSAVSPNRIANRIKVPVFLAAGGEDRVAPVEHTRAMEGALRSAGVPVESLYYRNESHGFYTDEHRTEYYAKLLDFLSRQIGGAKAAGGSTVAAKD